ncbi:MAG: hypothetical protein DIU71_00635 [Proteobacteria bacterium]|nr:MAG: hypothetical protein DIU71_00635 [Pseudomonadota bacterium]
MTPCISGYPRRAGCWPAASAALLCALLVLSLGSERAAAGQDEPALQQQLADARIDGQITAVYALSDQLDALGIEVDVRAGVVRLRGSVPSQAERALAAELARAIKGVADVQDELEVVDTAELSPERRARRIARAQERDGLRRAVADASISAVVRSKLHANQNTRDLPIAVATQDHVVTLTGEVASAEERELAELLVRNAQNVRDVRNRLTIRTASAAQ